MKQRALPGVEFARALSRQLVSSQSYLLGRFVKWAARAWHRVSDHAPRLENTAPFLRRDPPHSLRGNGPLAAILQQTQAALVAPKLCQAAATEPQLSSLRFHPGAVVRHHGRTPTYQQDRNSAVQRYLPVLAGPLAVPDPSTWRRFLKGRSTRSVRQLVSLHDQWRAQLFPLPRRRTPLTLDLHSVVLTV